MGYKGWKEDREIDWDKISSDAPAPLEPGVYKLEVAEAKAQESSKGDPSARLLLEAVETSDGEEVNRRKVFDNITFSDTAAFKAKQLCEALDVDPPPRTGYKFITEWCKDLVGMSVWAILRTNTYQGKKNSKVDIYINEEDLDEAIAKFESGDSDDDDDKPARSVGRKKKAPAKRRGRKPKEEEEEEEVDDEETEELTDDEGADEAEDDEEEAPPARKKKAAVKRGRPARGARARAARS